MELTGVGVLARLAVVTVLVLVPALTGCSTPADPDPLTQPVWTERALPAQSGPAPTGDAGRSSTPSPARAGGSPPSARARVVRTATPA
ncbi:MAG: hypothetical protein LH477_04110 [Nocardioides sp.]|nr:hypothetical protein [Nocardioides sp.]